MKYCYDRISTRGKSEIDMWSQRRSIKSQSRLTLFVLVAVAATCAFVYFSKSSAVLDSETTEAPRKGGVACAPAPICKPDQKSCPPPSPCTCPPPIKCPVVDPPPPRSTESAPCPNEGPSLLPRRTFRHQFLIPHQIDHISLKTNTNMEKEAVQIRFTLNDDRTKTFVWPMAPLDRIDALGLAASHFDLTDKFSQLRCAHSLREDTPRQT